MAVKTDLKWYYRTWFLALMLFSPLAPVSVVLMWIGKRYHRVVRWILTPIFGLCALVFVVAWLSIFGLISPEKTERAEKETIVEKATKKEPVETEKQRKAQNLCQQAQSLLEQAQVSLAQNQFTSASDSTKKAIGFLNEAKDFPESTKLLSEARQLLDSIKEMEKQGKEIEKANKKLVEKEVKKAHDFYKKKDYKRACEHYSKAQKLNPRALDGRHERQFSISQEKLRKAEILCQQAQSLLEQAQVSLVQNQFTSASDSTKKAVRLLKKAKGFPESAKVLSETKQLLASIKEAEKQKKEIEKINKKLAEREVKKANDFYKKKDYQSACEHYANAKELNPRALAEKHERQFSISQEKLRKAEILYQQAQSLLKQAQVFLVQNEFTSASDSTKEATRLLKKAEDFSGSAKLLSKAEQFLASIGEAEKKRDRLAQEEEEQKRLVQIEEAEREAQKGQVAIKNSEGITIKYSLPEIFTREGWLGNKYYIVFRFTIINGTGKLYEFKQGDIHVYVEAGGHPYGEKIDKDKFSEIQGKYPLLGYMSFDKLRKKGKIEAGGRVYCVTMFQVELDRYAKVTEVEIDIPPLQTKIKTRLRKAWDQYTYISPTNLYEKLAYIQWNEKLTDAQRAKLLDKTWPKHQFKWVRWTGTLLNVGSYGQAEIVFSPFIHAECGFSSDSKIVDYSKGRRVKFEGKLLDFKKEAGVVYAVFELTDCKLVK